jgi:hypothetical protein
MPIDCVGIESDERTGLDTVVTHLVNDALIWHYLPNWNGPWRRYQSSRLDRLS